MATEYKHVDVNSPGGGDGSSWNILPDLGGNEDATNAYSLAEWDDYMEAAVPTDAVSYIKEGSYTLVDGLDCSARDGTGPLPILIIGVKAETTNTGASVVFSDWSRLAADRPFFDCSSLGMVLGDYYIVRNLSFQGETTRALYAQNFCVIENCKFENDNASSSAEYGLYGLAGNTVLNCEFFSTNSGGLSLGGRGNRVFYCYFHDMPDATNGKAINNGGESDTIMFNTFDNCHIGLECTDDNRATFTNNTVYDCDIGINATTDYAYCVVNNIFSDCATDAVKWSTQTNENLFWANHMYNNADDWDGVAETGPWADLAATSGDPKFTAAGSDFSLQSSSPCLDAGMSLILGV